MKDHGQFLIFLLNLGHPEPIILKIFAVIFISIRLLITKRKRDMTIQRICSQSRPPDFVARAYMWYASFTAISSVMTLKTIFSMFSLRFSFRSISARSRSCSYENLRGSLASMGKSSTSYPITD